MGRQVKAKLVRGQPVSLDFLVEDQWISYDMICPKCSNKIFVVAIDKSRIACTDQDCHAVMFIRTPETSVDMSEVSWKI